MIEVSSKGKKIGLIPDVHQDIPWVESILERENDADFFIFLGDWFDTHKKIHRNNLYGARATARWLAERMRNHPEDIFCIGNHDLSYWELIEKRHSFKSKFYVCSGCTKSKMNNIYKEMHMRHQWERFVPFVVVDKYNIISHAGIHPTIAKKHSMKNLHEEYLSAVSNFDVKSEVLTPGIMRGGDQSVGGITWLDWFYEFAPVRNHRQIVGHTSTYNTTKIMLNGEVSKNDVCIDGGQTVYAIIDDGDLSTLSTVEDKQLHAEHIDEFYSDIRGKRLEKMISLFL